MYYIYRFKNTNYLLNLKLGEIAKIVYSKEYSERYYYNHRFSYIRASFMRDKIKAQMTTLL